MVWIEVRGRADAPKKIGNDIGRRRTDGAAGISRSTVDLGYRRAVELMNTAGEVRGPKKLGIPGAGSYLYPMLIRFGVIRAADPHSLLQTP